MSRILLVDALALVYRAFYAIPALTTRSGQQVNAVLGFIKTIHQARQIWQPSHCAVVFDGGTPPARRELLAEYKTQRPPMPDALRGQLPVIEEYLECAGIAGLRVDLQEADDLLATLAVRGEQSGMEPLILSADKDLLQLASENISLIIPGKVEQRIDPAVVLARTGVRPDQIVDWLALIGDTADNIPGVPGVGPKTATRWLAAWGNLEGILAHQDELRPDKSRQALISHHELVRRNVALVRLQTDLPDLPSPSDLQPLPRDASRLLAFYRKYEFHALAREIEEPTLF